VEQEQSDHERSEEVPDAVSEQRAPPAEAVSLLGDRSLNPARVSTCYTCSSDDAQDTLRTGARIGRYVVIGQLGAGGMGGVYAARDPELDRKVAIKLLHSSVGGARLLREARALAKLAHPNVVTVYDVGTFADRPFIAMELVDGITLRGWLGERWRSWREVLDMFMHAGRGLSAAHAVSLVHRDFKPENVMVGRDGRVRVLDFGIVSEAAEDAHGLTLEAIEVLDLTRLTVTGALIGTPAYMAPEQFRTEEVDGRTDQFAFCVALWEAVYGARPFPGNTLRELRFAVTNGTITRPPRDRAAPTWLRGILMRGLAVDRADRFASMDELLAAVATRIRSEDSSARLIGRRYEPIQRRSLPTLAAGERVIDRLTGKVVALERLGPQRDDGTRDSTDMRLSLAHAFRDLAALRHPNVADVLEIGFDHAKRPYLVLDLRDATDDLFTAARHLPASLQIDLFVQLLRALAYLNRRRIVLGAIAPESVRVTGGQIRLIPLGVAVDAGRMHPGYCAPEVEGGQPLRPAADLYAAGVLGFELFARRHPFDGKGRGADAPDLAAMGVEPKVAAVIGRLLEAEPAARYSCAEEVIAALATATGRPLAADTVETRESFLLTAPLVGREAEVEKLGAALLDAMNGRGSAWLVGGESGVGKSRLLEEVRSRALARGALVLRGQAESESGSPYRLFRDALRWLALLADLDRLETSVLLPVVPDLAGLLGRSVTSAPELDAPAMHRRLSDVVKRVLCRQEQPVVLLLEDLQWARSDSLKLLQSICPLVRADSDRPLPLYIVATYRNDELPSLHDQLPEMQRVDLARLEGEAIAVLTGAMMGDAGRKSEVMKLIRRETEGNPFFIVEVVRALADEAGGLDRIGMAVLPEKVFSGGIRRLVQRRLCKVPENARALLRLAAVVGRKVDPRLLEALAPGTDLESWVSRCIEAAVLERIGDEYRFSHDKLREGILLDLSEEELSSLHGQVGGALERVYPDHPERYASLAHHFQSALDLSKEAHYAKLAGVEARRNGAFREAIELLERARVLCERSGPEPVELAQILTELGTARLGLGDPVGAVRDLSTAIVVTGYSAPGRVASLTFMLLWQVILQVMQWAVPGLLRIKNGERRRQTLIAAEAADSLLDGYSLMLVDGSSIIAASLLSANCGDRAGSPRAVALTTLAIAAGATGMNCVARAYIARAGVGATGTSPSFTWVAARNRESLYWTSVGEFARAYELCRETTQGALGIGDSLGAHIAEGLQAMNVFCLGRLAEHVDLYHSSFRHLSGHGDIYEVSRTHLYAFALSAAGRHEEAFKRLEEVSARARDDVPLFRALRLAVTAFVRVRRGDVHGAVRDANEAVQDFKLVLQVPACLPHVFFGPACAHIAFWTSMSEATREGTGEIAKAALRHLRLMRAWARMYPSGWPQALLFEGQIERLRERPGRAKSALMRARVRASLLSMPYYEGLAHLELARLSAPGSPDTEAHLRDARALFQRCQAAHELCEVEQMSGSGGSPAAPSSRAGSISGPAAPTGDRRAMHQPR
jgi:serine/threonine protein kinase